MKTRSRSPIRNTGIMIQRPVSPPSTLGATLPTSLTRTRPNSRKRAGGAALALVIAIGGIFFFVEMRSAPIAMSPAQQSPSITGIFNSSEPPVVRDEADPEQNDLPANGAATQGDRVVREFRSFESFEEYVGTWREKSALPIPVVRRDDEEVTIPSIIIVGAERSGTTSLFKMLSQHVDVAALVSDGTDGFMAQDPVSYPAEAEWPGDGLETELSVVALGSLYGAYARSYTLAEARLAGSTTQLLTFERQASYFATPLAPYRLKVSMPEAKIIILLRDPVDRYYSELREVLCQDEDKIDWEDLDRSFAKPNAYKEYLSTAVLNYSPYDKKCLGVGANAADLWACEQAAQMTHRPLLRGLYEAQVNRWFRAFDRKQVKIVSSTELFATPEAVAADVAKFAGLAPHDFYEFAVDREASCDPRRKSKTIAAAYAKRKESEPALRKWYAEHNDVLFEDLGRDFGWNDRIRSMRLPQAKER